nr:PRD domain-containing protein [uncultured Clostridium sp.]
MDDNILDCFDLIINYINKQLNHTLNNNIYTAFALHINTLIRRINNDKPIVNPNLSKIKKLYKKEFQIALGIREILENTLNISVSLEECGYLALFLVPEMKFSDSIDDMVKIIVIAHGESTASSMKDVVSKLLGEDCIIAIDAPIEISAAEILNKLRDIIKNTKSNGGYLLLVDMGSFTTFAEIIEDEFNIPAKVVPLVSTLHVLEAARKALMKSSLNSIYKDVLMVNSYINVGKNNKSPEKKKTLILSACLTGKGGSIAIKNFLKDTFTIDENIFEIMVIDCLDKNNFINNINNLYEKYNILFIVTPFSLDINMNIPHFTMYEVLNLSTKAKIQELLDVETTLANMPEVLKENITAIPSNNLYEKIMNFIASVEKSLNIFISHKKKVELILHLAFAINRLITNEDMVEYSNKTSIKKSYNKLYSTVKSSLIPIETYFSIKLTDDEICYIMDFIIN